MFVIATQRIILNDHSAIAFTEWKHWSLYMQSKRYIQRIHSIDMKTTQTMKFWQTKTSEEKIKFAIKVIFRMSQEVRNISAVALGLYQYGLTSEEIQTAFDRQFAYGIAQKNLREQVKLVKEVMESIS